MKVHGIMIKLKEMDFMSRKIFQNIQVNGTLIKSTVSEKNLGQTIPNMMAIMNSERKMVSEILNGQTAQAMLENSKTITSTEKEFTLGQMAAGTKALGSKIKCMGMGYNF